VSANRNKGNNAQCTAQINEAVNPIESRFRANLWLFELILLFAIHLQNR